MWTTNDTSWRRTSSWRQIPIECHSRLLHRQLHSVGDWQHLLRVRKCKASIQWTLAFFINVICLLQHVEHWALLESFVYNLVHCPSRFPTSQHVFSNCFYRGIWNEHQTKPPPSFLPICSYNSCNLLSLQTHIPIDPTTPHSQHLRAPHLFLSIQSTQLQLIQLILPHIIRCFLRWRSKRRSIYEIDHYFVMCSFE